MKNQVIRNTAVNAVFGGIREIMKNCAKLKSLIFPDRTRIFNKAELINGHEELKGTFAPGLKLERKNEAAQTDADSRLPIRLFHTLDMGCDGLLSVEDILRLHDDLITGIRDLLPVTEDEFNERLMPLLKNFTAFAYTLPASEYYHHHEFLGLVTHSLETAFFAVRGLFDECFDFGLPGGRRTMRESRVAGCVFAAALLHDAGKPLTDITVHTDNRCLSTSARNIKGASVHATGKWNPLNGGFYAFLKDRGCSSYLFEYVPLRGKRHEKLALTAAGLIIPREFTSWIMEEPDLMEELCASINCDRTSMFYDLIKKSDIMSVRYHLGGIRLGGVKTGDRNGLPPELVPLTEEIFIHNGGFWTSDDRDDGTVNPDKKRGGHHTKKSSPHLHDRFNVFRRMNDNATGIIGLTVELLQQKISDSLNPCNAMDSCLFFTEKECILSVNPRNFFDMTAPLKNTGIPGIVSDSMDLYEKLILTGIGEYADGKGTMILKRIIVSFDGVNLTEIHGVRIIRPEYLYGGLRPAPLALYEGDMMRAFDAVKSIKNGVRINHEDDVLSDSPKERNPVTVKECLEYLKAHPLSSSDEDDAPSEKITEAYADTEADSDISDTYAASKEKLNHTGNHPLNLNEIENLTEEKGNNPRNKEIKAPSSERALAESTSSQRDKSTHTVRSLSFLLHDPVNHVPSFAGGKKSIREFCVENFNHRDASGIDPKVTAGKIHDAKSRKPYEFTGSALIDSGIPNEGEGFYSPAGNDWFLNPLRIAVDTRQRDAHGRFVKSKKKADDSMTKQNELNENKVEPIKEAKLINQANLTIPEKEPETDTGTEGSCKVNTDGSDELFSLITLISGFDDIRIYGALSLFTIHQLNSLARKIVRRAGRRGGRTLKNETDAENSASIDKKLTENKSSEKKSFEKKLYVRIVPSLMKACTAAVEKHALSDILMSGDPGVEELTSLKPRDAVKAMMSMTVIQKISFLKRIRDKALKR